MQNLRRRRGCGEAGRHALAQDFVKGAVIVGGALALTVLVFAMALSSVEGQAQAFDFEGWEWQGAIETDAEDAGFLRLPLTPEIIEKSQPSLSDLRVLDESDTLAPHVIRTPSHRGDGPGGRPRQPSFIVDAVVTQVEPEEDAPSQTIFDFDLGRRNLPVYAFELKVSDPFFNRRFELLGRSATTETIRRRSEMGWDQLEREVPWSNVARGRFFRIQRDEEPGIWTWECPIVGPPTGGDGEPGFGAKLRKPNFARLLLTPGVVDKSQRSLNDLRILDEAGTLVPHVVHRDLSEAPAPTWEGVHLVNRTYRTGEYARVTLDFRRRAVKNRLRVALSGQNFRRYAVLEGREGGSDWSTVDTAWLVDISDAQRTFTVDTFRFPPNDFAYLRLTVFNMEDEDGRIEIEGVQTVHVEKPEPPKVPVDAEITALGSVEEPSNATIFEIDLGFKNVPAMLLEFDAGDVYFHRGFELRGRNLSAVQVRRKVETGWHNLEGDVPWSFARKGVFYRIQRDNGVAQPLKAEQPLKVEEHLSIEDISIPYRYLELRIFNADDRPLDIGPAQIRVTRRELPSLAFEYEPEHTYTLIFANLRAGAPQYDTARAIAGVGSQDLPQVTLETPRPLDTARKLPPARTTRARISELLSIDNLRTRHRYLRLRVFHGDDRPLDIDREGFTIRRWNLPSLVFRYEPGHDYRLVFGNGRAGAPRYDLASAVANVGEYEMPLAAVRVTAPIVHVARLGPWTERYTWAVWAVLILTVCLVVALILRNLGNLRVE